MNQYKYKAVVFDLDGTLLDTLEDLKNSANAAAAMHGMETCTLEQIRSYVGNGIRNLIAQVVPQGTEHPEFEEVLSDFKAHYGEHCMDETEPYPGIMALLDGLKKAGVRTAIVSNKADFAVKKLKDVYFNELIDVAIGEREDVRRKPAPDSVLTALQELGISKEDAVYVGDSEVDIKTAQNADMPCVTVTWGFREAAYLLQEGADEDRMAANVSELKALLSLE